MSTNALDYTNSFERAKKSFVRLTSQRFFLRIVFTASLGAFLLISIEWFNVNDFMYGVAAAVWDQNGRLYTDVPFPQAPFSIILNLIVIKLLGTFDIFLIARIASIVFVLSAVLLPPFLFRREKPSAIWTIFVAVCLTNPYIHSNSREIGNYAFPLLCLSFAVTIIETRCFPPLMRTFLACAAIALATSTKLYFSIMCPAIFLHLLITEKEVRHLKGVAACFAGFSLGLSPILFFLMRDYESFLKWTVYVFFDFLKTRESTMMGGAASPAQPWYESLHFFGQMLIPLGFMAFRLIEERQSGGSYFVAGKLILILSACVMAVAPGFVNDQYFAPLALLMFLFSVPDISSSDRLRSRYIVFFLVLFCTQIGIMTEHGVRQYLDGSKGFDVVEVVRIKNRAHEIVDAGYKCERRFYSAEPLFLLDHRVRYPRELGAGPFLLFLGRRDLRKIGDDFDVISRIKQWKPDIVVWGYFVDSTVPAADEVDRIVKTYALQEKFRIVPLGSFDQRDIFLGYREGCRG